MFYVDFEKPIEPQKNAIKDGCNALEGLLATTGWLYLEGILRQELESSLLALEGCTSGEMALKLAAEIAATRRVLRLPAQAVKQGQAVLEQVAVTEKEQTRK